MPGWVRAGRGGDVLGDEGDVVEDHGEQVVEIMRDAPRELAEALQSLSLRLQPFLPLQGLPGIAPLGVDPSPSRNDRAL
jgi:hypothetical protein